MKLDVTQAAAEPYIKCMRCRVISDVPLLRSQSHYAIHESQALVVHCPCCLILSPFSCRPTGKTGRTCGG
jgi:hypothetical protein